MPTQTTDTIQHRLVLLTKIAATGERLPIYVNPTYIQTVYRDDFEHCTKVSIHGYNPIKVLESPEAIARMVNG